VQYDQLLATWTVTAPCDATQTQPVQLGQFRQLSRLLGASVPACYQVRYFCESCQGVHTALATQQILDWEPLQGLWPVYHDFMVGKDSWASSPADWVERLRHGQWPLQGWCSHQRKITGLWPSQLRAVEPASEGFVVCFECPACEELEYERMAAERLLYGGV
jgi:hypothetical protein